MQSLGIIAHPHKPQALEASKILAKTAGERGLRVVDDLSTEPVDLIVALGGDGTILRAAAVATATGALLLGINVGRLGYLSAIDADGIQEALDALTSKTYKVEERMVLRAVVGDGDKEVTALNEVALEKASPSRVVEISVTVGDEPVATYTADGFIVSTPTGSTAYSLSAGGPIVEPGVEAMILTPVSAHSPLWRSVVVKASRPIHLQAVQGNILVSADGQEVASLAEGEKVRVSPNPEKLKLVDLQTHEFFARVRSRFRIGDSG